MIFDILGIVSLMGCAAAAGVAFGYDLGEARTSRIWEDHVRELREHISKISYKAMLFAEDDPVSERSIELAFGPSERHSVEDNALGYYETLLRAHSQRISK